jgi:hypothetical protein
MAKPTNSLIAFSDAAAQLVERSASSIVATAVADGRQAASIGVPASLSLLKKFWSGTSTSRLRFQEVA